ncbi:ROK family protein [Puerhibacterium puerhi]|uniref:ROK family protein n=1 Tax=Puerhibacterium puerhi TaxID=2692623 RepID=UPI001F23BA17|nr:ROK family protein [Puerhibacterium puerhi]
MTAHVVLNSPHLVRRANAAALLRAVWDARPFTANDAMAATGLTRSTALALCDHLADLGWLSELADARAAGEYSKGRPARRYAFRPTAGLLLGLDAGQNRITAVVADLRAQVLAHGVARLPRDNLDPQIRRDGVGRAVHLALTEAGAHEDDVLAAVVGVPAPTDRHGASPPGEDGYWARMNPDLRSVLSRPGRTVLVENDANLAAVAEGAVGAGAGSTAFAALLAGERLGAGLMVDGHLLRGRAGGAGELRMLELVEGVGSSLGLGPVARELLRQAADAGRLAADSPLLGEDGVQELFRAAAAHDPVAVEVVEALTDRLARVCAAIATLLDLELVVVAGAIATALGPLTAAVTARLERYAHPPLPVVVASRLGADAVGVGAVHRALELVRADPLGFDVAGRGHAPAH